MKEKWLNDYSAIAPEASKQSSLLLAFTCIFSLIGLLCVSTSLSAQPNKNNKKVKANAPTAMPEMPAPPDHIETVEPMPVIETKPAMVEPSTEQTLSPVMNPKKAEEVLSFPPALEAPMPVELEQAVAEFAHPTTAISAMPAELSNKIADLESKVQALETKQTLFENELKQLRHQAEQPEEQDIEHSSAPLGNHKEVVVPSIEEVGHEEEL